MDINEKCVLYWNNIHKDYNLEDIKYDNWLEKFYNIIDQCNTPIIDLGCGSGNNTLYLMNKGKKVIACDLSKNAIDNIRKNLPEVYDTKCFDMLKGLPFENDSCEIIIADLSLHYFKQEDTKRIIREIKRVLKNNGYLIFRVNSVNDINHGAGKGEVIEKNLYLGENGFFKRFFDEQDVYKFFSDFEIQYIKEEKMNRYKLEKIVYSCCAKNK